MMYLYFAAISIFFLCLQGVQLQKSAETNNTVSWLLLCVIFPPLSWYTYCSILMRQRLRGSHSFASVVAIFLVLYLLICLAGFSGISHRISVLPVCIVWFLVPLTSLMARIWRQQFTGRQDRARGKACQAIKKK